jgi:heme A synthase
MKTIEIIIESIKMHRPFFYNLLVILLLVVTGTLAVKMELQIPITLVMIYAVFTLKISPFLRKFIKIENRDKYRYVVSAIMICIFFLFLIKDFIKNNFYFLS